MDVLEGFTGYTVRRKSFNRDHVMGNAIGLGVAAVGFFLYRKNQAKVDGFLREQGIQTKKMFDNIEEMSSEALTEMKEHIEDLIAEKAGEVKEKVKK